MVSRAFNQGFWLLTLYIEKQLNIYLDTLINCMNLFFVVLAHANVHPVAGWVRRRLQVSSRTQEAV